MAVVAPTATPSVLSGKKRILAVTKRQSKYLVVPNYLVNSRRALIKFPISRESKKLYDLFNRLSSALIKQLKLGDLLL